MGTYHRFYQGCTAVPRLQRLPNDPRGGRRPERVPRRTVKEGLHSPIYISVRVPLLFIKKNGKLRPVQDYRKVDAVAPPLTINDIIPLHK